MLDEFERNMFSWSLPESRQEMTLIKSYKNAQDLHEAWKVVEYMDL